MSGPYAGTPTWTEQGFRAVMDTWRGVIGPRGLSAEQVAYWDQVLAKAVATDTWKREVERNTWVANYLTSAQTRKLFDADYAEFKVLMTELGLIK
jgi:putative tricarboxylic transport membrane protein